VLILTGYGLNCEEESAYAWETAGASAHRMHLKELLRAPQRLHEFAALMLIGGFSFGDHMGSGHVFAARIRHRVSHDLRRFIQEGKLVLGICNGFQTMIKLGLLPGLDRDYGTQRLALIQNACGTFQNFWVQVRFDPTSPCIFTRGLETMSLPVRNGEGRLYAPDRHILERVEAAGCAVCRYLDPGTGAPARGYPHNPSESVNAIAGLCDPSGRLLGLMPHPEAYLYPENHPQWDFRKQDLPSRGEGIRIFENAVRYLSD